ncbi:glycosyltransferase [Paracoccus thiocyanatus]|uniref:Glycosyltransferase n=1 Tax=Paracoccus thiocyanatus TaxID=34006 RepID=A0A3D8P6W5_9RHOB|nr:glycosyltransferase [Paracoccus thiocyanatus]RDW11813.1 glycosyltransferase [Paracoccus thiocyanatus]
MSQPETFPSVIAAVVVTFNRLAHLQETLARLLSEPLDQVVVVENGSTDGTRAWLAGQADPRLLVLEMPENGGGALGFEVGMREARQRLDPDWLVLMDDDARPAAGTIARFRQGLAAGRWPGAEALAAAVRFPDGRICEMNRPWVNPFGKLSVFLRVLAGGGRAAFHIPDSDYDSPAPRTLDGTSFVGFFVSRAGMDRAGYPDGRLFIYGDDVLYSLGLTQAGGRLLFAPDLKFEHDCQTQAAGAMLRPLWKNYYHHRNQWLVYRRVAGRLLFPPLMALMLPKWLNKGRLLPPAERRICRKLIRLAVADAFRGHLGRSHADILARIHSTPPDRMAAASPGPAAPVVPAPDHARTDRPAVSAAPTTPPATGER